MKTIESNVSSTATVSAPAVASTVAPTVTKTAKATKVKAAKVEKREYTERGTTVPARRVVLTNGKPAGRGKPATEGKSKRTFVFLPLGVKYDAAKHGVGKKYAPHQHADKVFIRMPIAEAVKLGMKAPKAVTVKTKAVRAKIKAQKAVAIVQTPAVETPVTAETVPAVSAEATAALS